MSPEDVAEACGSDPSWACEQVLDLTGNESLADVADWIFGAPLRIALIVVGGLILLALVKRSIRSTLLRLTSASVQRRLDATAELAPDSATETREAAIRAGQRVEAIVLVLQSAAAFVILLIAVFLILGEIGISLAPLLAGAGVVGLAIGFGAQALVRDFFAGIFILIEDQFAVGDIVDLGEATGVVENVSLRSTRLRSVDGVVWHIPNGEIHRVGNMSQHWSRSLLDIEVAYDTDLKQAKETIKRVADAYAEAEDDVIDEPAVWGIEALGASGIAIRLVVKTRPSEQWRISRELRERIKEAFDDAGIEIPFPQQTVWMRTEPGAVPGPVGGPEPGD